MPALAQRPCNPCRGGVEPLTREQCAPYLTEVSDWELDATARRITRRFQFRDYRTALAFTNAVSALAENLAHPELALHEASARSAFDQPQDEQSARVRFRHGGFVLMRWPGGVQIHLAATAAPT